MGAGPAELMAAKRALKAAVDASDSRAVLAARARFEALRAAEPNSGVLATWVATADWRAVSLLAYRDKDRKAAKKQCKAGIEMAARAAKLDPSLAEAHAIHAALLGVSIGLGNPMVAGMTTGPKVDAAEKRARELAPDNPRLLLIEGIGMVHRPSFVGGGADKALPRLREAIAAFERATAADSTAFDWGHDDAHAWAGQAAMKLGDPAAARTHFLRALEINPHQGWVRAILLPAAEKALAAKSGPAGDAS
jgi:tetratricopeptide (TPR) repeat protein